VIISRTPFRISFFGGGTDYPIWYRDHGGAVLATTIDKYCYITCRQLPPFFEHKSRLVYSKVEHVKSNKEIEHPAIRAALQYMKMAEGLEIHHDGDLPARTGLGSSSSFTVGLLNALYGLKGMRVKKQQLANEAIHLEQVVLKENVGCQDQMIAAYGGLNRINFSAQSDIQVSPVPLSRERRRHFQDHLMLFFTGISRFASKIVKVQIEKTPERSRELSTIYSQVEEAQDILQGSGDIELFGKLLHETWLLKRSLTDLVSNPTIDAIYEKARQAGAIGGKLLGAGGGGFFLFFARPEVQPRIVEALKGCLHVPFSMETRASEVIFYDPDEAYALLPQTAASEAKPAGTDPHILALEKK